MYSIRDDPRMALLTWQCWVVMCVSLSSMYLSLLASPSLWQRDAHGLQLLDGATACLRNGPYYNRCTSAVYVAG